MISELVNLPLALLFAAGPPAALAANPIAAGLVESFNKPGGNATGMTLITGPLAQKRLELLREIAPKAVNLAMLAKPPARLRVPVIYPFREFAESGGLISYGANLANTYQQAGVYTGRILRPRYPHNSTL